MTTSVGVAGRRWVRSAMSVFQCASIEGVSDGWNARPCRGCSTKTSPSTNRHPSRLYSSACRTPWRMNSRVASTTSVKFRPRRSTQRTTNVSPALSGSNNSLPSGRPASLVLTPLIPSSVIVDFEPGSIGLGALVLGGLADQRETLHLRMINVK
jgi:hypothetical protein